MFNVKTIEETTKLIQNKFKGLYTRTSTIKTADAKGFVVSDDIISKEEVPHFTRSTVDGYAVQSKSISQASVSSPIPLIVIGESIMGEECKISIDSDQSVYVPTGGHIPKNADAVVMIEDTELLHNNVLIQKGASPNQNLLLKGSDIAINDVVVEKGRILNDALIGALMALGIEEIKVYEKIKILIISTGDEITDKKEISIGEIRDINRFTIASFLAKYPIEVTDKVVVKDDFETYLEMVKHGLENNDIVIASGGSSVGEKDYTIKVMEKLETEVLVHGINIKPGKPTILASKNNGIFLGLPGQPTSSYIVLNELFKHIFYSFLDIKDKLIPTYIKGYLTQNIHASHGRKLYQIVGVEMEDEVYVTPLRAKSGMIQTLSKAYGYVVLDDNQEGLQKGDEVTVYRLGD